MDQDKDDQKPEPVSRPKAIEYLGVATISGGIQQSTRRVGAAPARTYKRLGLQALLAVAVIAALSGISIRLARGQSTFRVISGLNGYSQSAGIAEGAPGVFYAASGGAACVFSVNIKGTLTNLGCFPNGTLVTSALVPAANERFYSGEWVSGSPTGNVFSVGAKPGTLKTYLQQNITPMLLANLPDGSLVGWADAQLGGQTYLIKSDPEGILTQIAQFPNDDIPSNVVVYGTDGNFYGTARAGYGGPGNYSYVYKVTPSGTLSKIYNFAGNYFFSGTNFYSLAQANDGNLYGVTPYGGSGGGGTFYRVTTGGQYTLLYTFPASGAASLPQALIQASDGNFYGTTLGSGGKEAFFKMTPTGQYTAIHTMTGYDGQCQCELVQGSDGLIYGISSNLGAAGDGTFFAVNLGLPKPPPQALSFTPQTGPPGTQVRVWGYNLLKASVQFNGSSATGVRNSGSNYVFATVPNGATSGPITVATPGGTSTTTASFTVQ